MIRFGVVRSESIRAWLPGLPSFYLSWCSFLLIMARSKIWTINWVRMDLRLSFPSGKGFHRVCPPRRPSLVEMIRHPWTGDQAIRRIIANRRHSCSRGGRVANLNLEVPMRPLCYSINVMLDGCCDHQAGIPDEETHRHGAESIGAEKLETSPLRPAGLPLPVRGSRFAKPGQRSWAQVLGLG